MKRLKQESNESSTLPVKESLDINQRSDEPTAAAKTVLGSNSAFSVYNSGTKSGTTSQQKTTDASTLKSSNKSAFSRVGPGGKTAPCRVTVKAAPSSKSNSTNALLTVDDPNDMTMQSCSSIPSKPVSPVIPPSSIKPISDLSQRAVGNKPLFQSIHSEQDALDQARDKGISSTPKKFNAISLGGSHQADKSTRDQISTEGIKLQSAYLRAAPPSQYFSSYLSQKFYKAANQGSWRFMQNLGTQKGFQQKQESSYLKSKNGFQDFQKSKLFSGEQQADAKNGLRFPHQVLMEPQPKSPAGLSLSATKADKMKNQDDVARKLEDQFMLDPEAITDRMLQKSTEASLRSRSSGIIPRESCVIAASDPGLASSASNLNLSTESRDSFDSGSQNSVDYRNDKIRRYWKKKARRNSQKKVRYGCRQNLAKQRFRHQGRFIKKEELDKLDPDQIYDPNVRQVPKTKQIFKITKEPRNRSSSSSRSGSLFGTAEMVSPPLVGFKGQRSTLMNTAFNLPLSMHQQTIAKLQVQRMNDQLNKASTSRDDFISQERQGFANPTIEKSRQEVDATQPETLQESFNSDLGSVSAVNYALARNMTANKAMSDTPQAVPIGQQDEEMQDYDDPSNSQMQLF